MKLGLVQSNILWEDKQKNKEKAIEWITKAATQGVELLLFPEMSFTGFSMNVSDIGEKETDTESTWNFLREMAERYGIHIGAGWTKTVGNKGENHYTIVSRNGEVILDYTKIHPFSYSGEDKYYQAGEGYKVVTLDGIPLTVFICYDLRFPMNFWKASEQAHFIIVPANWPKRRIEQWKTLLKARAIENQVYIAAINCVGEIGGIDYSGASCFINPKGEVIEMIEDKEELIVIDWEDDVNRQREKFPVHKDRRPEER